MATLRVGDVIYARGEYVAITKIDYATPREGLVTLTTPAGALPAVGASRRVSLAPVE